MISATGDPGPRDRRHDDGRGRRSALWASLLCLSLLPAALAAAPGGPAQNHGAESGVAWFSVVLPGALLVLCLILFLAFRIFYRKCRRLQVQRRRLAAEIMLREHVEMVLRDREKRLQHAQRLAGLRSWEWKLSGDKTRWLDEAFRLLSLIPDQGDAENELSVRRVHVEDKPLILDALEKSLVRNEPFEVEFRGVREDGSLSYLNCRGEVSRDGNGRPQAVAGTVMDVTEYRRNEQRLRELASVDGLTGAFTRHHFFDLAQREFARSRRYGAPLGAMMIDLDGFKQLNDAYGHGFGDKVLRGAVRGFQDCLRRTDILGRYGGDEFAVVLPHASMAEIVETAERLRRQVEGLRFGLSGEGGFGQLTVSVGCAIMAEEDEAVEMTLKRADKALYMAKQAGRNTVRSQ